MEELWEKGEAGVDFDSSPRIIEPEHFQCMFMIVGCIFSLYLIVLLWDILSNPSFGFYKIMLAGLFICFLITFVNLYLFSTAFWRPITRDTEERKDKWGNIQSPAKEIFIGDYEINMKILVNNKMVAFAILGYGAVTSFIFIFVAMMRSLGKTHFLMIFKIRFLINLGETYYKSTNEIRADKRGIFSRVEKDFSLIILYRSCG